MSNSAHSPEDQAKRRSEDQAKRRSEDQAKRLSEEQAKRLRLNVLIVSITLFALFLLGVSLILGRNGLHSFCSGALWALGCLAVGWLMGFLFGLPRVHRTELPDRESTSSKHGSQEGFVQKKLTGQDDGGNLGLDTNTNLEEISDWLTKMLVGIGLTELRSVPGDLGRAGAYVGQSLGSGMQSTGSSIIVYFLGLGFLGGFLLTRMYLGPAFRRADQATKYGEQDALWMVLAEVDEKSIEGDQRLAKEAEVDRVIAGAKDELNELRANPESTPPAARISNLIDKLESYFPLFPRKRRLSIILARLYVEGRNKNYEKGIATLTRFVKEKLKAGEKDVNVADALFNIACYYSMQMPSEPESNTRKELEIKGVDVMLQSIAINPEIIKDFRTDPDAASLRDSEGGRAVLATLDGDGSPPSK